MLRYFKLIFEQIQIMELQYVVLQQKNSRNSLDVITRECLRIATGAFKTTPIESLIVLANKMKLQDRRDLLSLRHFSKIRGNIGNSSHSVVVYLQCRILFKNKGLIPPLNTRIQDMFQKYKLRKKYVKAQSSRIEYLVLAPLHGPCNLLISTFSWPAT